MAKLTHKAAKLAHKAAKFANKAAKLVPEGGKLAAKVCIACSKTFSCTPKNLYYKNSI